MCKKDIIDRWTEYINELYKKERTDVVTNFNEQGPHILPDEVEEAIKHQKSGKAPCPDNIVKEEIEAMGEFEKKILTKLLNDIYNSGDIPKDLLKSIYISIPKKQEQLNAKTTALLT